MVIWMILSVFLLSVPNLRAVHLVYLFIEYSEQFFIGFYFVSLLNPSWVYDASCIHTEFVFHFLCYQFSPRIPFNITVLI